MALGLALLIACTTPPVARARTTGSEPPLLDQLLSVLQTGDQAAYEGFVQSAYSPAALAEAPAQDWAAALARIYTDTGGLQLERVLTEEPNKVQALAQARLTGLSYCLTLSRSSTTGRETVADFASAAVYPAGPHLKTPEPGELVALADGLASKFTAAGEFSGVMLLAKDGKVFFRKAYGEESLAYRSPMTLETRLNIASIGKSLTGVAIAQLVDAGKLSFDHTVGEVLPDYPDPPVRDKVTIRQLLTHTSGMGPEDYYDDPRWPAMRLRLNTVSDYMRLVVGKPLGAEPGSRYEYSNSGYVLLGAIIEKASGQSFYDYVRDHIFAPARMRDSFYHQLDQEEPRVATPLTHFVAKDELRYIYRLGRPRNATVDLALKGGPQGGAYVTADDLFRFETALLAGRLTSRATLRQMLEPGGLAVSGRRGAQTETQPGLGFEVTRRNGHRIIGHNGGDFGIASIVYHYPQSAYTVIVLSNRDARAARVLHQTFNGVITRRSLDGAVPPAQPCQASTI